MHSEGILFLCFQSVLRAIVLFPHSCEKDVAVLDYRAPSLAAKCISSHFSSDREAAVVLDVACGTGLLAKQVHSQDKGRKMFMHHILVQK